MTGIPEERGHTRGSALWGSTKGGRGIAGIVTLAVALSVPVAAAADKGGAAPVVATTYVPAKLLAAAQASPGNKFDVIVEAQQADTSADVAAKIKGLGKLKRQFTSIAGVSATLPGAEILALAKRDSGVRSITPDNPVHVDNLTPAQLWPLVMGADKSWPKDAVTCATDPLTGFQIDAACAPLAAFVPPKPPAIAIVDSGIDTSRAAEFGARVVASVGLSTLSPGLTGDGAGHGTFVASIAANQTPLYPGVAPTADLVSVRVMDDQGRAYTSDVIAACDWLLANGATYGVKVANFSLHSDHAGSFKFDPLDRAVERLWFSGITVVAASGNYGKSTSIPESNAATVPVNMYYAPGNDPFVITVGAADIHDTLTTADDDVAWWSAYGYTADGYAKPDVVAPGRYMIGAIPPTSTIAVSKADHIVAPGYIRLSGTSFAAPAVAAAAAVLLANHPTWGPDDVKGALMATAHPLNVANPLADGIGEVDLAAANALNRAPNPHSVLGKWIVPNATVAGGKSFDAVSWNDAARLDRSWNAVSWSDLSWKSVSWYDTTYASVSWSDTAFTSVSWSDMASADMALKDVSWSDVSWYDVAYHD